MGKFQATLTILLLLAAGALNAQVFNNSKILGEKQFAVGVQPLLNLDANKDKMSLFLHGGMGINSQMDVGIKIGLGKTNYFGADLEYKISDMFSASVGLHAFGDFGLDGTLIATLPLSETTDIYFGFDWVYRHASLPI